VCIELGSKAVRMVVRGTIVHDPAKDKGNIKKKKSFIWGRAMDCLRIEKSLDFRKI